MQRPDPSIFDNDDTIVAFSNSILAHYGVKPFHQTLEAADKAMDGHRRICVVLFDGLGKYNLALSKRAGSYITEHSIATIKAVNPATTVASTTSFLTGKFPIETGWLGWSLYFDELGACVDVFPNRYSKSGKDLEEPGYMDKICPVKKLDALLGEAGVKAELLYQETVKEAHTFKDGKDCVRQAKAFFDDGGEFLYCYFPEPDHTEHEYGVRNRHVRKKVRQCAKTMRKLAEALPDVLFFSLADHGLIDVVYRDMCAFKDLYSLVDGPLSIEGRNCSVKVKEGKKAEFEETFERRFGPFFTLLSRDEALSRRYFGDGEPSQRALSFIGDYIIIPTSNQLMTASADHDGVSFLRGHHGGPTPEERLITLAAYNL
jgi:hypothetical protein